MITSRLLEEKDLPMLTDSLATSEFHKDTDTSFFTKEGTISNVYELDNEPILVVRACKSLRLDIEFLDNNDVQRNREVMLEGLPLLAEQAKANGFTELYFDTKNPLLKRFCEKRLGFKTVDGDTLRKAL